jgi:hypothetical protein
MPSSVLGLSMLQQRCTSSSLMTPCDAAQHQPLPMLTPLLFDCLLAALNFVYLAIGAMVGSYIQVRGAAMSRLMQSSTGQHCPAWGTDTGTPYQQPAAVFMISAPIYTNSNVCISSINRRACGCGQAIGRPPGSGRDTCRGC